ncbi:YraN family protein [Patescibacteria group bacterium]|nr:YraN family protein [Patescibacteria group bacterium]
MDKKELGQFGENIACEYLKRKGYKILDRNYIKIWDDKTKGEIDIIAKSQSNVFDILRGKKDNAVCFIEVKTIIEGSGFLPEDKVDYKKRKKLIKLSQNWFLEKKIPSESQWQIDVIGILVNRDTLFRLSASDGQAKKAKIRHFENVVAES